MGKEIATNASSPEGVVTQVSSVDSVVEEATYEFDPASVGLDVSDEDLSESSLAGFDDEESTEETKEEETQETSTSDESSKEEEKESDEKKTEETKASEEKKPADSESLDAKPPKGFVPLSALHEARDTNRDLREINRSLMARLDRLEQQLSQPRQQQEETSETFKVLSRTEYDQLAEDNPAEAMKYLMDLKTHEDTQREKAESERAQRNSQAYIEDVVADTSRLMEAELPGILNPESDMYKGLVEFAPKIGFESDMYYLTNPATQVILPGETEPLLLGDQALSMLKLLNNAKSMISQAESNQVDKESLKAEIEADLRKTIEAELLEKFKTTKPGEFKSIKQVPKTEEDIPSYTGKVLTEAQMAKLSERDLEAYLAGE